MFTKLQASALVVSVLATATIATTAANATPLTGTFQITVYQGVGNGTSSDPIEQANLANPLLNPLLYPTALVGSFTYIGGLNFNSPPGANTVAGFIATGGGTTIGTVPGTILSSGGFTDTTLLVITGNTAGSTIGGTVSHDDGASLYQGTTPIFESAGPTTDVANSYAGLIGPFTLLYVEANGLPADLTFDVTSVVPEPASVALLGAGLAVLGLARRRKVA